MCRKRMEAYFQAKKGKKQSLRKNHEKGVEQGLRISNSQKES
jgi:hypothetical protein